MWIMMDFDVDFKANYRVTRAEGAYRFQYFCALCDYYYASGWITAASEDEARALADKEARKRFNGCHQCGRWICDDHYDMDQMMCALCARVNGQEVRCLPPIAEAARHSKEKNGGKANGK